jgi:hypothetical protein
MPFVVSFSKSSKIKQEASNSVDRYGYRAEIGRSFENKESSLNFIETKRKKLISFLSKPSHCVGYCKIFFEVLSYLFDGLTKLYHRDNIRLETSFGVKVTEIINRKKIK